MKYVYFLLCLLLSHSAFAQNQTLKQRFSGLDSFSTAFKQKLFDADNELLEETKGYLSIERPNRFRLEYKEPYYQLYVATGKQLIFYDRDLEQVIIKNQKNMLENTPAMILSNPNKLDKNYTIKRKGIVDELAWYELTPKDENNNFVQITLAFKQKLLYVMEMRDTFGQITRLEFSSPKNNPDLDPRLFKFVPPEGVDVINN
jgi:outer membrane lipoprotein carrier protein